MKRFIIYLPFVLLLLVGCSKAEEGGASDTSDIDKYGLVKENMTNWQRGDGTVGISGIKINGKVVDVNYGYCNWFADDLKPILDSLYYTKGSSIRFPKPKPTDLRPIGDLCDSLSR